MSYTARFPSTAVQRHFYNVLAELPEDLQDRIMQAVAGLQSNPRPFGAKSFKQLTPPVKLYEHAAQYRVRIGDCRVLYEVDDSRKIVWVLAVRKRSEGTYR